ncbi:UbiX family flavin prenyltransferase [Paenibacillus flagellatus]|uniref:Flavin prenyltransferase UbiX n=1 Tax=Paenibacillus flagellatus TaxID=2211139 RepID=A0A2V5KA36_9BACL|nr:flavin prenyltransferase UbiX [Paenibacillus flagellatus]PYI54924.1 aromatic acid decarboxylase [Paenibacillus flagellatus]
MVTSGSAGWVVGLTGASGAVYGVRLCEELLARRLPVHLVVTDAGWRVLHEELGWDAAHRQRTIEERFARFETKPRYYPINDIGAAIASGSFRTAGMAIVPCSMGTLSGIAHGASGNLLERAADVMLKERRKLILVPRETPLHAIHLENMLKLAKLGVGIVPAMPAYYQKPQTMDELVDFMVGKVLDYMGIDNELFRRWGDA